MILKRFLSVVIVYETIPPACELKDVSLRPLIITLFPTDIYGHMLLIHLTCDRGPARLDSI